MANTLRLPFVAIEIQGKGGPETAASIRTPSGDGHELPLTFPGRAGRHHVPAGRYAEPAPLIGRVAAAERALTADSRTSS